MNMFMKFSIVIFLFVQISLSQTSVEWEQIHIPPDTGNVSNAMAVAPDGSVYITGQSMYSTNGSTGWYWLTVKYDTQGNLIWENIYQSEFLSSDNQPFAIYLDEQGYIYVTGYGTAPLPHPWEQFLTIKYNPNGDVEWMATFNSPFIDDVPMHDRGKHLVVDKRGNVYVTGICMVIDFTTGDVHYDIGTVKYNPDGELVWSHIYGSEEEYDDEPIGIAVNEDGDVFIAATITTPDTLGRKSDFTVMMYDRDGNLKWIDRYNSSEDGDDHPYCMILDDGGNVYVAGNQRTSNDLDRDLYIAKFDTNGEKLWDDVINQLNPSSGGGFYQLLLENNSFLYAIGEDSEGNVLIKYDLDGNKQWKSNWDVPSGAPFSASLDSEGNIYVGVEIWLGPDHSPMSAMVAKFDSAGQMLWETTYESGVDTDNGLWTLFPAGIGLDNEENIYIGGHVYRYGEKAEGQNAYFVAKLVQTGETNVNARGLDYHFKLDQNYPNPFNPTTKISYSIPASDFVTLKIYDVVGREITTLINSYQQAGQYTVVFDASALSSGTYFYTLKIGESVTTKKMSLVK